MEVFHKTRKIPVKWAKVDIEMVPIVNFFNRQPGIETMYCCQGIEESDKQIQPHVVFTAADQQNLEGLVLALRNIGIFERWLAGIQVNAYVGHNYKIKYAIYLANIKDRERWVKLIKRHTKKRRQRSQKS
jgi:hypothetical protein